MAAWWHVVCSSYFNVCFHLETVAADGLVTGAGVKAGVHAWSGGHQQAAHLGDVATVQSHTFMTLQQGTEEKLCRGVHREKAPTS